MTTNDITFIVVEFVKDKSLAVIPSSWLIQPDKAVWPPLHGSRCQKMAKRKDPQESAWEVFTVKEWLRTGKTL